MTRLEPDVMELAKAPDVPRREAVSRILRNPVPLLVMIGLLALAVYGAFHVAGANTADVAATLLPPSGQHLLGTDQLGRDVFTRVAVGSGISFVAALIATAVGAVGGLILALISGLGSRWIDRVLMAIVDAVLSFPQLILALALSVALGAGLQSAVVGIAITMIPVFARTLRAEVVSATSLPYVQAARTIGLGRVRISTTHIVPKISVTFFIQFGANFGFAILTLAGLSFIGVGAQPPTAEWGAMISDGLSYMLSGQWWIGVGPGVALLIMVVAVNSLIDQQLSGMGSARRVRRAKAL